MCAPPPTLKPVASETHVSFYSKRSIKVLSFDKLRLLCYRLRKIDAPSIETDFFNRRVLSTSSYISLTFILTINFIIFILTGIFLNLRMGTTCTKLPKTRAHTQQVNSNNQQLSLPSQEEAGEF